MATMPRILFVDDEKNVIKALRRHFLDDPFEVFTATSGGEGLEILEQTPVEIVVSDFRMPHMNGAEFLKLVSERWPETVRIILSGYTDIPSLIASINEGEIFRYISKPWKENELKDAIQDAIAKHHELSELRMFVEESFTRCRHQLQSELTDIIQDDFHRRELKQTDPELALYQRAFQCLGTPLIIFNEKGDVLKMNPAADQLLHLVSIKEGTEPLKTDFIRPLRETALQILNKNSPSKQRCRIFCSDISYEALLSPLSEHSEMDGVVTMLWCLDKEDRQSVSSSILNE